MFAKFSQFTSSRPFAFAKEFVARVGKHDLLTLAGALAFNTALSLAPLVLILLMIVSLLGYHAQDQLIAQVQDLLGQPAAQAIHLVIDNANQKPTLGSVAGIFGVIMLLISASSVFAQLQSSLNVIWETNADQSAGFWSWLKKRVLSMGMVLAVGFVAAVSLLVSSVIAFLFQESGGIWHVLNLIVSIGIFSLLFALIFSYLPDVKMPFTKSLEGGFLTAVLFSIGKFAIGLYLGKSAVSSSYGAAGSLVVMLIWVYYSSFIVFAGAELTRLLAGDSKLTPN